LTQAHFDRFPDNHYTLLDGSSGMLDRARETFVGPKFSFIRRTFEGHLASPVADQHYDYVCSANALHHLDYLQKQAMYQRIYRELKSGGLFLNFDVVRPESERSESWQFRMWTDWMNQN